MISFNSIGTFGYCRIVLIVMCLHLAIGTCGKAAADETNFISGIGGPAGSASQAERYAYFNNFMIFQTDAHARNRVLVCDVVIELNPGARLSKDNIELRKSIYNILNSRLNLTELRKQSKNKIKTVLNNFMGAEIIKDVYFTKIVLL